ncbi:MAG: KH domain-containing protein [Clostridia bacterium]|nr:KH domain-containing protein [Clostridia bacterium]
MYKELVEYIVKCLVSKKDEVNITEEQVGDRLVLKVKVATEDMGRIIGKEGRIIRGIREIIRAYSTKEKAKVSIDIVE